MLDRTFGFVQGGVVGWVRNTSALEEGRISLCDVTFIRQGKNMFERFFSRITLTKHSRPNSQQGLIYATPIFEHGAHAVCVKKQTAAGDQ